MARIKEFDQYEMDEMEFDGTFEEFLEYLKTNNVSFKYDREEKIVFVKNSFGANSAILEYYKGE